MAMEGGDMSRIGTNRIGTDGEVYSIEATKHQTFVGEAFLREDATRKEKVKALAAALRDIADSLDKHADHDAFYTTPRPGGVVASEHITTDLVTLQGFAYLDDPLSSQRFREWGLGWNIHVRLNLGFL
jgi:hypothetical protein